jgi:hypothetical protein
VVLLERSTRRHRKYDFEMNCQPGLKIINSAVLLSPRHRDTTFGTARRSQRFHGAVLRLMVFTRTIAADFQAGCVLTACTVQYCQRHRLMTSFHL